MKTEREEMLAMLDIMLNEDEAYQKRLDAYEYLMEDCEPILEHMIEKMYAYEGDTGKMLMEVLACYKGNKAIFMGLVGYLYKGDDVALFARLIGSYGDEKGVEVLKTFCDGYEPNYNEYMEIRNAVEELGGDFDMKEDFSDDPFYRYLKGLDEEDEDSRRSPFEDYFNGSREEFDEDSDDPCCDDDCHCDDDCYCDDDCEDDCECDDDRHCHDDGCHCHDEERDHNGVHHRCSDDGDRGCHH